jgi:RNA polymerase sigma factor (sigma-70 family)
MLTIIQEPPDGYMPEESAWVHLELLRVYKRMRNNRDRLIFIACEEAGMRQEDVAFILGITQEAVSQRMKKILEYLRRLRKMNRL